MKLLMLVRVLTCSQVTHTLTKNAIKRRIDDDAVTLYQLLGVLEHTALAMIIVPKYSSFSTVIRGENASGP